MHNNDDEARATRVAARRAEDAARLKRNMRQAERRGHHTGVALLGRAHKCNYCAE